MSQAVKPARGARTGYFFCRMVPTAQVNAAHRTSSAPRGAPWRRWNSSQSSSAMPAMPSARPSSLRAVRRSPNSRTESGIAQAGMV